METIIVLIPLFIFIIGLIIGSFLNVVVFRLNTGRSASQGHSACMSCARRLRWYELIPVFSFLMQRGKCRTCREPLSFQYPFVELFTGILFVVVYMKVLFPFPLTLFSLLGFLGMLYVTSLLIVIVVYDIRHKIIPDTLVYQLIVLGIAVLLYRDIVLPSYGVFFGFFQALIVALPFYLIWFITRGKGMGFGDVKLALGMGFFTGLAGGITLFFISFWLGAIVGIILLAINKRYHLTSEIPFAPFMIVAFFVVVLWNVSLPSLLGIY